MEKAILSSVLSEEKIIQKIIAGEKALFEILIRRYNPVLYKLARAVYCDGMVQRVFESISSNL